ncbi:MAG: chromate efflux transporter [Verrucomicrobiales bacterium]
MDESANQTSESAVAPPLGECLKAWLTVGLLGFGGPAGQIALMHRELVEKRRWLSEERFLHALNYCMLLPGPEAHQLSIYSGWLLRGTWGGILAGACFLLPGALLMLGISALYIGFGASAGAPALLYGLKIAVLALVAGAVWKLGSKVLRTPLLVGVAVVAFVALFIGRVPFPLVIASALVFGWLAGKWIPEAFPSPATPTTVDSTRLMRKHPSVTATLRVALLWLCIWLAPILASSLVLGEGSVVTRLGWFFSQVAMVTFGGAYAVLPYVADHAVNTHGWLSAPQMMDGLGLAETTPGPLILVLQFVGFLAGWENGHGGWGQAILAAGISTWATFLPGHLFIFAGAPHIEASLGQKGLHAPLKSVSAAVTGVILNLAVWFALLLCFPSEGKVDVVAIVGALGLFAAMQRWKWGVLTVVAAGIAVGILRSSMS